MSEMEHWKGKIKRIKMPKKYDTWEKQVKYLQEKGYTFKDLDIEDQDFYSEESDVFFHEDKKEWFEFVSKKEIDDSEDVCTAIKQNDKEIFFELRFYNGGACFSEMLENALNEINKGGKQK